VRVFCLCSLFVVETTGVFSIIFANDASFASEELDIRRLTFRLTEAVVNRPSRMAAVRTMVGRG
jgi:hypothetical protein